MGKLNKASRNARKGVKRLNRIRGYFDASLKPLSGLKRTKALGRAKICGCPLGPALIALPNLDVFVRKKSDWKMKDFSFRRNRAFDDLNKAGYERLPENRACVVMDEEDNCYCVFVPHTVDPCVKHHLRFMESAMDISKKKKPMLKKRGVAFEGEMYMFGHFFNAFQNPPFQEYVYKASFPLILFLFHSLTFLGTTNVV